MKNNICQLWSLHYILGNTGKNLWKYAKLSLIENTSLRVNSYCKNDSDFDQSIYVSSLSLGVYLWSALLVTNAVAGVVFRQRIIIWFGLCALTIIETLKSLIFALNDNCASPSASFFFILKRIFLIFSLQRICVIEDPKFINTGLKSYLNIFLPINLFIKKISDF